MLQRMKRAVKRLLRAEVEPPMVRRVSKAFVGQADGTQRRDYASYEEYLAHQSEKIDYHFDQIRRHDEEYEAIVHTRFADKLRPGESVLCLGARLGGEVRALRSLGCLALGIDLNPGPQNRDVLPGDVHALQFADRVFDAVFTNILDHVYEPARFFAEIRRVLRPQGRVYFEINLAKPTRYEALDISDESAVLAAIRRDFEVLRIEPVHNRTSYVDWRGMLVEAKPGA